MDLLKIYESLSDRFYTTKCQFGLKIKFDKNSRFISIVAAIIDRFGHEVGQCHTEISVLMLSDVIFDLQQYVIDDLVKKINEAIDNNNML